MPFACRPHTEFKKLRIRCHDDRSTGRSSYFEGHPEESWTGASVLCTGWESNNESRPDSRKHPTQTPSTGAISPKPPVRSHTITSVENGVLAAAAKKPAIPTSRNAFGGGAHCGPSG